MEIQFQTLINPPTEQDKINHSQVSFDIFHLLSYKKLEMI